MRRKLGEDVIAYKDCLRGKDATILKMSGHYLGRKDEDEIIDALQKISDTEKECDIRFIEVWLKRKSKIWFKARQRTISDYL